MLQQIGDGLAPAQRRANGLIQRFINDLGLNVNQARGLVDRWRLVVVPFLAKFGEGLALKQHCNKKNKKGLLTGMKKRDIQTNGLECLSAVLSLCRRELAAPSATPSHHSPLLEFEAENFRLHALLKQRDRDCAEHLAAVHQLRDVRASLERKLADALREPLPPICYHPIPEVPLTPAGKDAGQWHLLARSLQMQTNAYKRELDAKGDELVRLRAAYHSLRASLSARGTETAQVAEATAACSSTEAP